MSEVIAISQHIDGFEIPIIEIREGWVASSVQSKQECNDAYAYLMSACASIEFQIDMEFAKPNSQRDDVWMAKARCALKYKKAALQIVNQRGSAISEAEKRAWQERRDRMLLEHIKGSVSHDQFMTWVNASQLLQMEEAA